MKRRNRYVLSAGILCLITILLVLMAAPLSASPPFAPNGKAGIVSISAGPYQMDILWIRAVDRAGDKTPERGVFLTLEILLHNLSNDKVTFYGDDFPAHVGDLDLKIDNMGAVRDAHYKGVDYPGYNNGQPVDANESEASLLVYDVPADISQIDLEFNPADNEASFTLWLIKQPNNSYNFGLETVYKGTGIYETFTPVPSPTPSLTPTWTLTPTITLTPSLTFTPSATFTPSITPSPTITLTPSITPTPSDTPMPTIQPQTRYVTTSVLNVRDCIGTQCIVIGQLEYGDSLHAIYQDKDSGGQVWYGFVMSGEVGWVAGWLTNSTKPAAVQPQPAAPAQQPAAPAQQPAAPAAPAFTCNCSKTCPQMASCEEAYFQLQQCGCAARDGDRDGVPCEDICPGG